MQFGVAFDEFVWTEDQYLHQWLGSTGRPTVTRYEINLYVLDSRY